MRVRVLIATTSIAACAAASVAAAPSPVAPAAGSSLSTTHPTFRWTLPKPEIANAILLASSPALGPKGYFVTSNLVDSDQLEPDATKWSPIRPLPAGTYWWQVATHDTTPGAPPGVLVSPPLRFTVELVIAKPAIALKWSGRQFLADVSVKANVKNVNVLVRLYNGRKVLEAHTGRTDNFLIDEPTHEQSVWTIPPAVKRGTRLRLEVTLSAAGRAAKMTATKTLHAP